MELAIQSSMMLLIRKQVAADRGNFLSFHVKSKIIPEKSPVTDKPHCFVF